MREIIEHHYTLIEGSIQDNTMPVVFPLKGHVIDTWTEFLKTRVTFIRKVVHQCGHRVGGDDPKEIIFSFDRKFLRRKQTVFAEWKATDVAGLIGEATFFAEV